MVNPLCILNKSGVSEPACLLQVLYKPALKCGEYLGFVEILIVNTSGLAAMNPKY